MKPDRLGKRVAWILMQPVLSWIHERLHQHWYPQIRVLAAGLAFKSPLSNPHYGQGGGVQFNGCSQNIRPAAETALPEVITDHGVGILSRTNRVFAAEDTANRGLDTQDGEVLFAHQASADGFHLPAGNPDLPFRQP